MKPTQTFYNNGELFCESYIVNDRYHNLKGPAYSSWYINGQLKSESYWINGELLSKMNYFKKLYTMGLISEGDLMVEMI